MPTFARASVIKPVTPKRAIPPNIPPGPRKANAAVIAAAPAKPVVAIVTTRMIPGNPRAATFRTTSSIPLTSKTLDINPTLDNPPQNPIHQLEGQILHRQARKGRKKAEFAQIL